MGNVTGRMINHIPEEYAKLLTVSESKTHASILASELNFTLSEPAEKYNLSSLRELKDKTIDDNPDLLEAATLSKFLVEGIVFNKNKIDVEIEPDALNAINHLEKKHTESYEALIKTSETEIPGVESQSKVRLAIFEMKNSGMDDLSKLSYNFQQDIKRIINFFIETNSYNIDEMDVANSLFPPNVLSQITDIIREVTGENKSISETAEHFKKINDEMISLKEDIGNNDRLKNKARSYKRKQQYETSSLSLNLAYKEAYKNLEDLYKGGESFEELNSFMIFAEIMKEVSDGVEQSLKKGVKINDAVFVDVKKIESTFNELEKIIGDNKNDGEAWEKIEKELDGLGISEKLSTRETALSYSHTVIDKLLARHDFNDQFENDFKNLESISHKANKLIKKQKNNSSNKARTKKNTQAENVGGKEKKGRSEITTIRREMRSSIVYPMSSEPEKIKRQKLSLHSNSDILSPREMALSESRNKNSIELNGRYDRLPQYPPEISTRSSLPGVRYVSNVAKKEWAIPTKLDEKGIIELSKNWANTSNVKFASVWNAMGYHLKKHGEPGELIEQYTKDAMSYADYATDKIKSDVFDIYKIPKQNTDADGYYLPTNQGTKIIFFHKKDGS